MPYQSQDYNRCNPVTSVEALREWIEHITKENKNESTDIKPLSDLIRIFKSQPISQIKKDTDQTKEKSGNEEKFAAFKHYAMFREDPSLNSLIGSRKK